MAGGGSRRDDAPLKIGSTNGFAVLDSLKKKKKSDSKSKSTSSSSSSKGQAKEKEPEVYYQPKPLVHKSWADVEDDEDDDYLETTEPLESIWGAAGTSKKKEIEAVIEEEAVEESESEDDLDDEDDVEDEHGQEIVDSVSGEPLEKKTPSVSSAPKDTERQLSKRELKKKGIEELDAILAELGIAGNNDRGQEQSTEERKISGENRNGGRKENAPVATESKSSKKKKAKKDKSSKEAKVSQEQQQLNGSHAGLDDANNTETPPVFDAKERLKKAVNSVKKKKSAKEVDAAAKVVAQEAAARNARLAAAKKKEKNHYNQQPVR
ncbi:putative stress response protein NST1 [Iris pallida]|uniref:Stress response protein NST1 n=1 Tax=Iris pallida TaxID=29817 RepID=A0AAX6FJY9_IRIPA|nr:putative stress response protein NST1 [Iris pallida]